MPANEQTPREVSPRRKLLVPGTAGSGTAMVWDQRGVQALINACYARGEEPGLLILGNREAQALRQHLRPLNPGMAEVKLKGFEYHGLHIVLLSVETCLRVESATTIFFASRHGMDKKK